MAQSDSIIQVTADFKPVGTRLEVRYTASNRSNEAVYVFSEMTKGYVAYVSFDDGVATVSHKLWPLPPGLLTDEPHVPKARLLKPGATFEKRFALAVPLAEINPYVDIGAARPRTRRTFDRIRFELGYVTGGDVAAPVPDSPQEETYTFDYYDVDMKQRVAAAPPVALRIEGELVAS